ncbi:MAG: flagellar basal-body rod modification protein FlgD [Porticoccus sp.]|jgi:flagellar basal-body rod modification protein FlgD|tara:strand:+ start:13258 stop:13938 length:681 start_codon:yes stop_codon:yes gene_type:complete
MIMSSVASLSELFPSTVQGETIKNNPNELGQEDFMTLLVTQLENQDPTKPMDNLEFISQLAQFGTVSGIQDLQGGFSGLSSVLYANQALQAAGLVGQEVSTSSNMGYLAEEGGELNATVALPGDATSLKLYVQDQSGQLIYSRSFGATEQGNLNVSWDGTDAEGNTVAPGRYRLSAEAWIDGQNEAVSVYPRQRVESVSVAGDGSGVLLNLADGSQVSISSVKSFH